MDLLRFASFFLFFDGLQLILAGALRGVGENTYTMRWSLLLGWLVFIPLCYVLTFYVDLQVYGPWVAFYIYIIGLLIAFGLKFIRMDWNGVQMKH